MAKMSSYKNGKGFCLLIIQPVGPIRTPLSSQLKILVRQPYEYALIHTKFADPFPGTARNKAFKKKKAKTVLAKE